MTEERTEPHAEWTGYTAIDTPDDHRWRFTHPDRHGRPVTVELTFPHDYGLADRFKSVAAIKRTLNCLPCDEASAPHRAV
jgi:hypothetical protein